MNIQSRLLTVDFFNCKGESFSNEEALRVKVSETLAALDLVPLQTITDVQENGHISLMALLPDGHLALHVHPDLRHVSLDIYAVRMQHSIPSRMSCAIYSNRKKSRAHICGEATFAHRRRFVRKPQPALPPYARSKVRAPR